jgi:hypothetical protein
MARSKQKWMQVALSHPVCAGRFWSTDDETDLVFAQGDEYWDKIDEKDAKVARTYNWFIQRETFMKFMQKFNVLSPAIQQSIVNDWNSVLSNENCNYWCEKEKYITI